MAEEWQTGTRISRRKRERYARMFALWLEQYQATGGSCAPPVEIRSGAIIETNPGVYLIDANTMKGLRQFHAKEATGGDPQSEYYSYPREARTLSNWAWTSTGYTATAHYNSGGQMNSSTTVVYLPLPPPEAPSEEQPTESSDERALTGAEVLAKLSSSTLTPDELREAVHEAETIAFDADQAAALKPLLQLYIANSRDNTDPADLVAVGSAIRKYVGILGRDEISSAGFILEAGHKAPVPLEVELEVTKMVVRKLSVVLPPEPNSLPELVGQLMDLARTYLNPRLLPRQHHGAIALNSVLALTLLRVPGLADLFESLRRLQLRWFKQLVVRRAEWLTQEFIQRFPGSEADPHRDSLDTLIRTAQPGT